MRMPLLCLRGATCGYMLLQRRCFPLESRRQTSMYVVMACQKLAPARREHDASAERGSVGEDLLGDAHGGHRSRSAGVERQVDDRFLQLRLSQAVVLCPHEVRSQLFGIAAGNQGGNRDQTAVPGSEFGALPNVAKQDVVGERYQLRREVAE